MSYDSITGTPENPEKKNRKEQLKIIIQRHNFLVDQVILLEKEFYEKEINLETFKEIIKEDIKQQKEQLELTKKLIQESEQIKKIISDKFKYTIKKPIFEKLEKRVNNIKYEDYIHREELLRKMN